MYNALVSGLDEFGKPSKQLVAEEGPTPDVQIQEPGLQEAQRAILAFYDELRSLDNKSKSWGGGAQEAMRAFGLTDALKANDATRRKKVMEAVSIPGAVAQMLLGGAMMSSMKLYSVVKAVYPHDARFSNFTKSFEYFVETVNRLAPQSPRPYKLFLPPILFSRIDPESTWEEHAGSGNREFTRVRSVRDAYSEFNKSVLEKARGTRENPPPGFVQEVLGMGYDRLDGKKQKSTVVRISPSYWDRYESDKVIDF
jgi:hypothetical protein